MASVAEMKQLLNDLKAELNAKLDAQKEELLAEMRQLRIQTSILACKQANSAASRSEKLAIVPKPDGTQPDGDFPPSIMHLLFAGNEPLPDGTMNTCKCQAHSGTLIDGLSLL